MDGPRGGGGGQSSRDNTAGLGSQPCPAYPAACCCCCPARRYYARGVFAWPIIANSSSWTYGGKAGAAKLKGQLYGVSSGVLSLIDWPLRCGVGGRACGCFACVRVCRVGGPTRHNCTGGGTPGRATPCASPEHRPSPRAPNTGRPPPLPRLVYRHLTGGAIMSKTCAVRSSGPSYDEKIAADLWDVSAEFAKLPKAPKV